jgi:hypothetical protein
MTTPFVKFVGVATTAAIVVASDRSLYSPCKASLNNFNENGCVCHFDAETEGRPSILKIMKYTGLRCNVLRIPTGFLNIENL